MKIKGRGLVYRGASPLLRAFSTRNCIVKNWLIGFGDSGGGRSNFPVFRWFPLTVVVVLKTRVLQRDAKFLTSWPL